MGLNGALNVAGRSLEIFTAGIEVAGNNVANSSTPGYIRETLSVSSSQPYEQGGLIIGSGASLDGIKQQIDLFLEQRIHVSNGDVEAAKQRDASYQQLQVIVNELGTSDLSSGLNDFVSSLNNVINQPELQGLRGSVVNQAQAFTDRVNSMRQEIDRLRSNTTQQIDVTVNEANKLIDEIGKLNTDILRLESGGLLKSDAGSLRSQRYTAMNRLSEIVPLRTINRENGMVELFTGDDFLVLGKQTRHLETQDEVNRGTVINQIKIKETQFEFLPEGGELRGLIDGRDQVMGGFIDDLDSYSAAIINQFNLIHSSGEGLKGFTSARGTYAIEDTSLALNQAGLPFTPKNGSFEIKVIDEGTGIANTTVVKIDLDGLGSNDTSLSDLQTALSAISNLTASISASGELQIDAADGYEFRFGNDNSGTLASLGLNTLFTGFDSGTIGVNSAVANDSSFLATGQGGGEADNRNAILLAQFTEHSQNSLSGDNISNFYQKVISSVAQSASSERALASGLEGFRDSLFSQRSQTTGVSLDEEAIKIMQFQQAFQAAARIITTIDELFNTLLSI